MPLSFGFRTAEDALLVLATGTAGSSRFLFTRGSPSALSAADRFVPADAGSTPWYAASSCGFAFLRAWGLALDVDAGGCEGAASTEVPGGAILTRGEDTGQSKIAEMSTGQNSQWGIGRF